MSIVGKIKRAVRGEVAPKFVALEALRRGRVVLARVRERASLKDRDRQAARLRPKYASMQAAELLEYFRQRSAPAFLPGFSRWQGVPGNSQRILFPDETTELLAGAVRIVSDHSWSLLGLGEKSFGNPINWHRDPISEINWPSDYHADINLTKGDGSDVRPLWELNRLSHFLTLARAYSVTNDERFAAEFFQQVENWRSQNPYGYGVNWSCAMEVALRAMNLLGAFEVFRHSRLLDEQKFAGLLAMFDQHGTFIRENLEFSYVATSNHYLSDVVGLVWLGIMAPELEASEAWRAFGLSEMLREMDKQVLADGTDFESSTGYHRFVLELFLYTFILCRSNGIQIHDKYWQKLHRMLNYLRAYLRPDGLAPLIGDSDSGQVFPIRPRSGNDHAYVLAIGAVAFEDPSLKLSDLAMPEEILWFLGEQGVGQYEELQPPEKPPVSEAFPDGGTYILRDRDLYLLFNTSGAGINGRGSHGHNDALSIEVSACGRAFIVDPGSYVYTADLHERHLFRSTAYHSTAQIDGLEQNTTDESLPFVIGDEAHPRVLFWETGAESDRISAEHEGYTRLAQPVIHRRTVTFNKRDRWWLIEDEFSGEGKHDVAVRFHFDSGIEVSSVDDRLVRAYDKTTGARLFVFSLDIPQQPDSEGQFISRDYFARSKSIAVCWRAVAEMPSTFRWMILPGRAGEVDSERLKLIERTAEPAS
jgi:uncharacterized heparinase superfamily protein